jgi:hypothetical protein
MWTRTRCTPSCRMSRPPMTPSLLLRSPTMAAVEVARRLGRPQRPQRLRRARDPGPAPWGPRRVPSKARPPAHGLGLALLRRRVGVVAAAAGLAEEAMGPRSLQELLEAAVAALLPAVIGFPKYYLCLCVVCFFLSLSLSLYLGFSLRASFLGRCLVGLIQDGFCFDCYPEAACCSKPIVACALKPKCLFHVPQAQAA